MGLSVSTPIRRGCLLTALLSASLAITGCQQAGPVEEMQEISATDVKFSESTYGVPASPRVTMSKQVKKGGGRVQIGKPYKVRGNWYYPKDEPGYVAEGRASWYGPNFHGRLTANGETYDMYGLSAAHKTFPLPSYAMVTNLDNGHKVMVRVNDRGPFSKGREIDLSSEAAELLDFKHAGIADVKVEYAGPAPLEGDDTHVLMATFEPGNGGNATSMVAGNETGRAGAVAMALNGETPPAATAVPGVRPLDSLFQNKPRGSRVADMLSSYTEEDATSGAGHALADLATEEANPFQRINLGTIDRSLMARVGDVVGVQSTMRAEATPEPDLVSATVTIAPNVDTDRLLRKLWAAGFDEAFTVRD